jgi:HSP20 family protein
MNNKMTRYPQWSGRGLQSDPVRQIFDRLFDGNLFHDSATDESSVVTSQWSPLVDIKEEADRFVVYADIPGVDPQDIEVQMDKGLLTVKGERSSEQTLETERYSRTERVHGSFHRRFALPDSADPEGITASGHNGVLQITIPKRPETTPRRIQVGPARKQNS